MLCAEVCAFYGVRGTLQHPTDGGYGSFHGLSKVQVNLQGPVLFQ